MRSNLLVLVAAAGALAWGQDPAGEKPAIVEGTVTNALTGEPLLRAHVTLRGVSGQNRQNLGALTDAAGKFSFSVPAGSYAANAERVGFSTTNDRRGRTGEQVTVRALDKKDDLKLKLNPNGAISGRVTDADGEPVEGVGVSAEGGRSRGMATSATTDDKGQFRLSGLGPGKYRIKARPMNLPLPPEIRSDGTVEAHYASTYYPNSQTGKGASQVNLGIGAEIGGIAIQLVRAPIVRISGTVAGAPRGERVMVEATAPQGSARQMGMLREDGTFQIWRLDPGKYLVSAMVNQNGLNLRTAPVEVEIAAANVDHIDLRMLPPSDIAGQVEFEDEQAKQGPQPPPGARQAQPQTTQPATPPKPSLTLIVRDTNGRSGSSAPVRPDGSFKIENLSPGRYRISASWMGVYVRSMRLGQMSFDGNVLDLSNGSNGAPLSVLVSSATGEISGVVTDDKGNPAAQIPVGLMQADWEQPTMVTMASTGNDGSYKLTGVPPGKYRVVASEDNLWSATQDEEADESEPIEFNRGDKVTRDLKLKPPVQ